MICINKPVLSKQKIWFFLLFLIEKISNKNESTCFVFFVYKGVEDSDNALDLKMDKILEDSVPCKIRAKRGCATHPRSIAERVTVFTCYNANTNLGFA